MNMPELSLYSKYGDPYKVVEFRAFSFNSCAAGCKNCYYQKSNNDFYDFSKSAYLGREFRDNGYTLETIYLLPTDVFENDFNFDIMKDSNFKETVSLFNYVGLASTLRGGFKKSSFDTIFDYVGDRKLELHLNLIESRIGHANYIDEISDSIVEIKKTYGNRVLVNLALNVGSEYTEDELTYIKNLVTKLSTDKILELNFTFLFNKKISHLEKAKLLLSAYPVFDFFSSEFKKNEKPYNYRTLLRKPSITFQRDKIFVSPIIPFDEYVFIDDPIYQMKSPTFDAFLNTYSEIQNHNLPIKQECETCDNFEYCYGKSFFAVANFFSLPCIKRC